MVDETRLIELLEGGASLAMCAAEFEVSRNAIHKRKQKLIAAGKINAPEASEEDQEDSGLSELERKAADTLDEFRATAEAHEFVKNRLSFLPREIEKAKRELAEVAAGFYIGEMSDEELATAEMELEDLEREHRTAGLAFPILEKKREELQSLSHKASFAVGQAAKAKPFTEMKACFLERGIPLKGQEEQELRSLAVGKQQYEVDALMKDLEDMTGLRRFQTGHAQPRT